MCHRTRFTTHKIVVETLEMGKGTWSVPEGVSQQTHLLEQLHVMCHNEELFPEGPPEQFMAACAGLEKYSDDVDPMVVIACDYIGILLDSGDISGTLDKLVCFVVPMHVLLS